MLLVSSQVTTWPQLSALSERFDFTLRPQRDTMESPAARVRGQMDSFPVSV